MVSLAREIGRLERGRRPWSGPPDFRALVGETAWLELPAAVRARFDPAADLTTRTFPGVMEVRLNGLGWLFAQACRLVGGPIAPWRGAAVPVSVTVRPAPGAILWERAYTFAGRPPLTIASRKESAADGSLLEVTRGGLGMRLAVSVEDGALVFRSTGYFWRLGAWLAPIPDALTPGRACVVHRDLGGGRFHFALSFVHPIAGETVFNAGDFRDPGADG